jgi:hypothetical protein
MSKARQYSELSRTELEQRRPSVTVWTLAEWWHSHTFENQYLWVREYSRHGRPSAAVRGVLELEAPQALPVVDGSSGDDWPAPGRWRSGEVEREAKKNLARTNYTYNNTVVRD